MAAAEARAVELRGIEAQLDLSDARFFLRAGPVFTLEKSRDRVYLFSQGFPFAEKETG